MSRRVNDKDNLNSTEVLEVDESWAIALLEKELGSPSLDADSVDISDQLECIFQHVQEESRNTLSAIEKQIQNRKNQLADQIQQINKSTNRQIFPRCQLGKKLKRLF